MNYLPGTFGSQSTLFTQEHAYVLQIGRHTTRKEILESARHHLICNISWTW